MNTTATIEGIYNLALVKLGISQFITDAETDVSLENTVCNTMWGSVLNEVLELSEWKSARKRTMLARHMAIISGATAAEPVVITATAHPFVNDELVKITEVVGMIELNDNTYMVKNQEANTFELYEEDGVTKVDGTGFTAYTSDGVAHGIPAWAYQYVYKLPADCIKILATSIDPYPWREEGCLLFTNAEDVEIGILYIYYLSDPIYFGPLLIDALATRLAYTISPALVKDYGPKRQELNQEFAALLVLSRSEDAMWRQNPDKHSALVTEA